MKSFATAVAQNNFDGGDCRFQHLANEMASAIAAVLSTCAPAAVLSSVRNRSEPPLL